MSPEERDRFQQFHGVAFPPLEPRDAWILALQLARPELAYYEAEKEWQNRMTNYAEWQIKQRKEQSMPEGGGKYDVQCEAALKSIPGADAVMLVVLNRYEPGSGFSLSCTRESISILFGLPKVLREVAAQLEAELKSLVETEKFAEDDAAQATPKPEAT